MVASYFSLQKWCFILKANSLLLFLKHRLRDFFLSRWHEDPFVHWRITAGNVGVCICGRIIGIGEVSRPVSIFMRWRLMLFRVAGCSSVCVIITLARCETETEHQKVISRPETYQM